PPGVRVAGDPAEVAVVAARVAIQVLVVAGDRVRLRLDETPTRGVRGLELRQSAVGVLLVTQREDGVVVPTVQQRRGRLLVAVGLRAVAAVVVGVGRVAGDVTRCCDHGVVARRAGRRGRRRGRRAGAGGCGRRAGAGLRRRRRGGCARGGRRWRRRGGGGDALAVVGADLGGGERLAVDRYLVEGLAAVVVAAPEQQRTGASVAGECERGGVREYAIDVPAHGASVIGEDQIRVRRARQGADAGPDVRAIPLEVD